MLLLLSAGVVLRQYRRRRLLQATRHDIGVGARAIAAGTTHARVDLVADARVVAFQHLLQERVFVALRVLIELPQFRAQTLICDHVAAEVARGIDAGRAAEVLRQQALIIVRPLA